VDKLHAFGATKVKAGETPATAKDTVADVAGAAEGKAYEAEDVASAKAGEAGSYVNESKSKAEDAAAETIQNVGENLFNDFAGEDDDTRTRRLKLLQVMVGDGKGILELHIVGGKINKVLKSQLVDLNSIFSLLEDITGTVDAVLQLVNKGKGGLELQNLLEEILGTCSS
jgi:hypothetical protein